LWPLDLPKISQNESRENWQEKGPKISQLLKKSLIHSNLKDMVRIKKLFSNLAQNKIGNL